VVSKEMQSAEYAFGERVGLTFWCWNLEEVTADGIIAIWNRLTHEEVFHLAELNKITAKEQLKIKGLLQNEHFLNWLPSLLQQVQTRMEVFTENAYERLCCHLVAKTINCKSQTVMSNIRLSLNRAYLRGFRSRSQALNAASTGRYIQGDQDANSCDGPCGDCYDEHEYPFTKKGNVRFIAYPETRQEAIRIPLPPELIQIISTF